MSDGWKRLAAAWTAAEATLPADCTYGNPDCEVCPRKPPPPATPTEENEE